MSWLPRLWKVFFLFSLVLLGIGLWWAFFNTPPDYQQGYSVRIMFMHVPAAWMAFWIYFLGGILSLGFILTRRGILSIITFALMPIGLVFAAICIVTGSLWGKPMWGTWWVWDARLTSTFILFLSYLAYVILWRAWGSNPKRDLICASFTLLSAINLPIVKFSVEWWYTLHQPSGLFTQGKVDDAFRFPLAIFLLFFASFSITIFLMRFQHLMEKEKKTMRRT